MPRKPTCKAIKIHATDKTVSKIANFNHKKNHESIDDISKAQGKLRMYILVMDN